MAKKTTKTTGKSTENSAGATDKATRAAKATPDSTAQTGPSMTPGITKEEAARLSDAIRKSMEEAPKPEVKEEAKEAVPAPAAPIEDAVILDEPAKDAATGAKTSAKAEADDGPTGAKDAQAAGDEQPKDMPRGATPPPAAITPPEPVVIRKGGFVPLVLGGVVAAGIGFAAARYVLPEGWPWPGADTGFETQVQETLDAQAQEIAALRAELGKAPDLSAATAPIEKRLSEIGGQVDDLSKLGERLDAMDSRLVALEKAPVTGSADPAAVAAYERELKALQGAMAEQRSEIEAMLKQAQEKDAAAQAAATLAQQRAALASVQSALESGAPFAEPLAVLQNTGAVVPAGLADAAENGVPSQSALVADFPAAARDALAAARKGETGGGFAAFLDRQLGARSLEPTEGDDPDAVLSRAEAALKEGRLGDAMALIEQLPQPAQDALQGWMAQAGTRADALAGAGELAAKYNAN